nr:hypothetical protein [Tanacetum cinerariifolium]
MSLSEEPEAILDRQERVMRKKTIPLVKMPPRRRNHVSNEADPAFTAAVAQVVADLLPTLTARITDEIRQNENNGNNDNRRNPMVPVFLWEIVGKVVGSVGNGGEMERKQGRGLTGDGGKIGCEQWLFKRGEDRVIVLGLLQNWSLWLIGTDLGYGAGFLLGKVGKVIGSSWSGGGVVRSGEKWVAGLAGDLG